MLRLEKLLERDNRRLRSRIGLYAVAIMAACVMGAADENSDIIQAEKFQVVNDDGDVLWEAGYDKDSGSSKLHDLNGKLVPLATVDSSVDDGATYVPATLPQHHVMDCAKVPV